ncbi:MAG: ribonuclease HII [Candidatus Doudnabacteria bacterium RIFCSPHIGHO2_01_FULL_45_18]|uniref:Ribonuclease HII n=1 Tax=Candidatus Doudnabacteria bacterium RIFCSPHIGHO2_01_FULL_45_18 TaxID=1817823 RepID=A0A1F5NSZ2_9BACT|nr:MAG: ribonuclease HII [Candidatus Doudnabacteria bacterium RIFCSPHIGHO2_01_FULL_45_18]
MRFPTYKFERKKYLEGFTRVAGCDEVGIGPLAGPVVAATVILDPQSIGLKRSKSKWWYRVRDSKTTSEQEREQLVEFIRDHSLDFAIGVVSHETIDKINIQQAAMLAMRQSLENLKKLPDFLFVDGLHKIHDLNLSQAAVVDGDAKILSIAAASIVAKVARDKILAKLHELYPKFGFVQHKGYPTQAHKAAIRKYGLTPVHRKSFAFVQQYL